MPKAIFYLLKGDFTLKALDPKKFFQLNGFRYLKAPIFGYLKVADPEPYSQRRGGSRRLGFISDLRMEL